jgi:uncharacterized protein
MKKLFLLFTLLTSLVAGESVKKVVFDLTTGDSKVFEKKVLSGIVRQKIYYEGKLQELKVAVVIHGDAYKFFVKNLQNTKYKDDKILLEKHDEYMKRLTTLADTYEVSIYMCDVGRNKHKLDIQDLYDFVEIIPNSTIGLIEQQNEGYAYVPIER